MDTPDLIVWILIILIFIGIPYLISYVIILRAEKKDKIIVDKKKTAGIWGAILFNIVFTSIFFALRVPPGGILFCYLLWWILFNEFVKSKFARIWPFYIKAYKNSRTNNQRKRNLLGDFSEKKRDSINITIEDLNNVKQKIRDNELKKVFVFFKNQVDIPFKYEEKIIKLQSKFTDVETQFEMGNILLERRNVEINKIRSALLRLVEKISIEISKSISH